MFDERTLEGPLAAVREHHAPGALVFDTQRDFETLSPAVAEELGLRVDSLDPATYDADWLPADAPDELRAYASGDFTIGMPGDGGVAWTRQTDPPCVFVKPRLTGSPDTFVEFLLAEALVQVGTGLPEHFLGFFESQYRDLCAVGLGPADSYQLANALYDAYVGLHTRETFRGWESDHPGLHAAWVDAGERLQPRLDDLSTEVATGRTEFAAAAELACSALKHDVDVPTPFDALDAEAYQHYGPEYALRWAEKTIAAMRGDDT
jgi:hypothetical protein